VANCSDHYVTPLNSSESRSIRKFVLWFGLLALTSIQLSCTIGQSTKPRFGQRLSAGLQPKPSRRQGRALQNAASISGLLLTTEAVITEAPEKGKGGAGGGMPGGGGLGGMGGMSGMDY